MNKKYYTPSDSIPHTPVIWLGWEEEPHKIFKTYEECEKYCNELNKKYTWSSNII